MALSRSFRPRSAGERHQMTQILSHAPRVVALTGPDDGWAAACLRVSGRVPVWANDSDPTRCEEVLKSFGLPGLGQEQPGGSLGPDGSLRVQEPKGAGALAPVDGPLISILICTYNRARMLKEAIASVRAQNWPFEIIVVNDGSTDETERVLDAMDDVRVVNQENRGKPSALNAGLKLVRGEAVLVLDDDDLLLPGALNVLGHALFSDASLAAVFGDSIIFEDQGERFSYWPGLRYPSEMMQAAVLQQIPCATGATLIRMAVQREVGEYDERLKRGEDMDMWLRLSQHGRIESIPLPTFLLRDHDGLRGSQGDRWSKKDADVDNARSLSYSRPVFRERWLAYREGADRQESHAWALGLWERRLKEEALEEVSRWSGPYTQSECWIRQRIGLVSVTQEFREAVVVVDDGDEGALEKCLNRHSSGRSIFVDLEVPRDPFGNIRLHWDGVYVANKRLTADWIDHAGPVHLRLSSDPEWSPPPIEDFSLLPDLPATEAVRCYAHVVGWPEPVSRRKGLNTPSSPLLGELRACRAHMEAGHNLRAIEALREILRLQPDWLGAWWIAADVFERAGLRDRARAFRNRVLSLQVARRAA